MFLVLRLRGIKFDPFRKRGGEEAGDEKVIALPAHGAKGDTESAGKAAQSGGTPLEQGLTQIKLDDSSFESDLLPLAQARKACLLHGGDMNEGIGGAVVGLDEPVPAADSLPLFAAVR